MAFYIIKEAVYLHGVYGPYDTRESAIAWFNNAYAQSPKNTYCNSFDGHHEYRLIEGLSFDIGADLPKGELIPYVGVRGDD